MKADKDLVSFQGVLFMALEFNRTTFLKVYTGEDVLYNDIPLYKAILREARRLGLSGGTVMVPSGATADDLTTEDTESDGQILRTYFFGGTQVGTAVVEDSSQESASDVLENGENMDSAKAYSESRSQIPYFAIGGVGILLLILLLWRMIRIIRS